MYQPEYHYELLSEWKEFCEGNKAYNSHHFDTILMGSFLGQYDDEKERYLFEFSKYFDPFVFESLKRIALPYTKEIDVLKWVNADITEKIKIFSSDASLNSVFDVLVSRKIEITNDMDVFQRSFYENDNSYKFYDRVGDYVIYNSIEDPRKEALENALYHIANSANLAHSIISPLITGGVDFSNYLEIYLSGADYNVLDDRILVIEYRKK